MARTLHEIAEAITVAWSQTLPFRKALNKRCFAASTCGAMIVADVEPLTLAWKEEGSDGAQETDDTFAIVTVPSGYKAPAQPHKSYARSSVRKKSKLKV